MSKDMISPEAEALCKITEGLERRIDTHEEVQGRDGTQIRRQMHAAVVDGLREVASDPEFWAAAAGAMRKHAQQQAGGFVMGALGALVSRVMLIAVAVWAVYSLGGLPALVAWLKSGGQS